jgi:2-dehydropantoate 2-reductase
LKDEQLSEFFGKDPVVGATTITGATLIGPGHAAYTLDGYSFFGEIGGGVSPRVQAIVDMYSKAGLKVQAAPDIVSTEWSKLVQSGPAMLVSAVTRLEYYKVCKGPDTARLFVAITKECAAVARACGVAIADYPGFNVKTVADAGDEDALRMIIRRGEDMEERGMTSGRISMLQDILAGRKTEIEEIAGYLVCLAQEKGVAVPATEFAYHVVRGIEHWL